MTQREDHTFMFKEASEAYIRVEDQLKYNADRLQNVGQDLRRRQPVFAMICARGSSSHAGIYLRYLIETRLGIPVTPVAPSVSSIFGAQQKLSGALFISISQSGQSPDIVAATQAAKKGQAFVIAIVNDETSPLATLADVVIPLRAGTENSVAATKTFICSLTAAAQLVANWGQIGSLSQSLGALPGKLKHAFLVDWSPAYREFEKANSLFVISRGLGLGIAKEAALKFKETCRIHAEAFSAAEVKHGPMALVRDGFPALIFATGDKAQASIDEAARPFIQRGARIFVSGATYDGAENLAGIDCQSAELRPILMVQTFYRFINGLSLRRGLNPDRPEFLNKVTETR